ncbi:hypothetical protein BDZ89DRAFT_1073998 [Hymenopellis radicata]|nr:hypothetical protein BDZ89DRAFT_1077949 [Hymenopellis radicata]KAF9018301.1 hypothetical protein BDZ89DRAFT_1073998 [Hymenopellis radicata]
MRGRALGKRSVPGVSKYTSYSEFNPGTRRVGIPETTTRTRVTVKDHQSRGLSYSTATAL